VRERERERERRAGRLFRLKATEFSHEGSGVERGDDEPTMREKAGDVVWAEGEAGWTSSTRFE
jgi:hypothetical protein